MCASKRAKKTSEMEDCKTLELSIKKTIYAENYKYEESKKNVENLLKTRRKSNHSTCSSTSTLASGHCETPQSCGSICVFNLHQKLIFNCEFCDLKYEDLDNFGRHLHEAHNLLLQTEEHVKENTCCESKSSKISNVVKREPLEPAIDLPPSYFTEPLVSCGSVFVLKGLRFLMACGYCDCTKYDNLEMFEKHIKSQHNILQGVHNEVNVVPKVEDTIKEEFFTITEVQDVQIKEELEQENEAKIKVEQNSKEYEKSVEEDEEIGSGEEFQDTESGEEEDEGDEESEDDDEEFMVEEPTSSLNKTKRKRLSSADGPSTSTASKKDATRKKKKDGLSMEEKFYACEHCDKKFKSKNQLKNHKTRHTGENNYKCDLCHKNFTTKSNLTIHKRLHTGEKPYECDICHKQYNTATRLRQHKKRWHLGEAAKSFKCQYCDKKYFENCDLKKHSRVHTGEKPYKCDICNKCYHSSGGLSKHKKLHLGEQVKTLKCDYCDKFFKWNFDRLLHMRGHTGEKPFKCDVCLQCFTRKNSLCEHVKKHHPATINKSINIV